MDPFRIVGNPVLCGTYDLGCCFDFQRKYSDQYRGVQSSGPEIKHNIESLGLKLKDIKILLTTQAHYDHVGAMAYIKGIPMQGSWLMPLMHKYWKMEQVWLWNE